MNWLNRKIVNFVSNEMQVRTLLFQKISMFYSNYFSIFIFLIFSVVLSAIIFFLSFFLSVKLDDTEKLSAYECGFNPFSILSLYEVDLSINPTPAILDNNQVNSVT